MSSLSKAKKFTRFVEIYLSKKAKCEKVDVNFSVKMKILTIQQRIKFRPDRVQWRVQSSKILNMKGLRNINFTAGL